MLHPVIPSCAGHPFRVCKSKSCSMAELPTVQLFAQLQHLALRLVQASVSSHHACCPDAASLACRGVPALAAFDLDDFLDSASRTRKWQCPHTLRHSSVQDLHSDAFVQRILDSLQVSLTILPHVGALLGDE